MSSLVAKNLFQMMAANGIDDFNKWYVSFTKMNSTILKSGLEHFRKQFRSQQFVVSKKVQL
jgi:hypothetical protein